MDEKWKQTVDKDMKSYNEMRVRLEEHDKNQEKDIAENKELISDLYDYKNNIYKKLTYLEVEKVSVKDHNALAKCVTQLKTEKKFLPWLVMITSLVVSIASLIFIVSKVTHSDKVKSSKEGTDVRVSRNTQ